MTKNILRVDASMRVQGSVTRQLADRLIERLGGTVTRRDLAAETIPNIDEAWIGANFTPEETRTPEQREKLSLSDKLIAELKAADTLVLAVPMYNFGAPAAFKAWIDMIARARVTFKYTDNGPVGLLEGKKAYVVLASGGTAFESDADHLSSYVIKVLNFIGITDIETFPAEKLMADAEAAIQNAVTAIDKAA